jgi:hypothetical protein
MSSKFAVPETVGSRSMIVLQKKESALQAGIASFHPAPTFGRTETPLRHKGVS